MIRPALKTDFDATYRIHSQPENAPYLNYGAYSDDALRVVFANWLTGGGMRVIVENENVIGFCNFTRYDARVAHVCALGPLAIDKGTRGSGVATRLLDAVIAELRDSGVKRVELYVEADNARAIRFYEKVGFQLEGRLAKYFNRGDDVYVDELVMARLFD